jgi:4-hydroxybenzoate polyprenyltransferase
MNPYFRLLRLHQPTGIWLLLWPCWWSITFASYGLPTAKLLVLFGLGAIVMRSAGCIINDIIDRDVDKYVERTRMRPLASGEILLKQAIILLIILLVFALCIALQMRPIVLILAACSLLFVVAYPFMKRITWWPQAFLGLTFNWGALMGWAAIRGEIDPPALLLYIGSIFWTLGYDTIYAHQDKIDDLVIGIKSTALRLGKNSIYWIAGFYMLAVLSWLFAGISHPVGILYYIVLAAVAMHFSWQIVKVDLDNAASAMRIFVSNRILGWIVFVAILADKFSWVVPGFF